jgi:hypothetical protein
MSEFIEVTAELRAQREQEAQQARYEQRQAARMGQLYDANGNPVSVEQFRQELARADEMKAVADRDFHANQRIRAEEARVQAAERAEQERQAQKERAARTKEEQRGIWIARGLDPDRFEAQWPQLEIALALGQGGDDDLDARIKRQKLREMGYNLP